MAGQIDRALSVLELLSDQPQGRSLGEIAEAIAIPKSATHRILATLIERDFVEQDRSTQHYRLSIRLAALGFRHLAGIGLAEICQPQLDALAASTGEFVRLGVVTGERLSFIAEAQGARSGLRYEGAFGRRDVRLHATATGKAWLATLPEEDAVRLVLQQGFGTPEELGPRVITTIPALLTDLARTRRQGYATVYEEADPGVAAVSAVIPGHGKDAPVVGTIAVIGPIVRLTRKRMAGVGAEVIEAAGRLSLMWPSHPYRPTDALAGE